MEHFASMIASLNKQGIHELLQNDYESSVRTFRMLLGHVRGYARSVSCTHQHCQHTTHLQAFEMQKPEVGDNGSIFFPVVFCNAPVGANDNDNDQDTMNDTTVPAYSARSHYQNSALASNRCKLCQRTVCLQSAMICYNLAVSHHFCSIRHSQHRSSHVQMAIQCYRHAMTLTHAVQPSLRDGSGLLFVALGNNLAFLFAELCDFASVEGCITWTLARMPEADSVMGPFLSNAVIWQMLESQPSPAA